MTSSGGESRCTDPLRPSLRGCGFVACLDACFARSPLGPFFCHAPFLEETAGERGLPQSLNFRWRVPSQSSGTTTFLHTNPGGFPNPDESVVADSRRANQVTHRGSTHRRRDRFEIDCPFASAFDLSGLTFCDLDRRAHLWLGTRS